MDKKIKKIALVLLALIIVIAIFFTTKINNKSTEVEQEKIIIQSSQEEQINKDTIEYTGWLKTSGAELQNEKGEPIQLRGISSHGIAWFSELITEENLKTLKEDWNINVFRIAMYTDPNAQGYIANPEKNKEKVYEIIELAKKLDMYVIVDWHILNDNNPKIYEAQSEMFFDEVSKKYSDTPNVIYEICNEPNGQNVTWEKDVKPYADHIIGTIRKNSPKSLVIVGTPNWCLNIDNVIDKTLSYENVIYSCHFYAGTHGQEIREKIDECQKNNIPIFVSECGITNATGAGEIYEKEYKTWIEYLNSKNISWLYWSLSNKDEASSILVPEYAVEKNNDSETEEIKKDMNEYLTESGKIIKEIMTSYKK